MNLLFLSHFTAFIICVWLIYFIISLNPKAALNRICGAMIGSYAIWNLAFSFLQASDSKNTAMLWENIAALGWTSFPCFSLWCTIVLTRNETFMKKWYLYPLLFFWPVFFVYKQWTGSIIIDLIHNDYWWGSVWSDSIWPWTFYAYYSFFMTIIIYLGIVFIKKSKLIKGKKTGIWLILAIIFLLTNLGSVTDVLLPRLKLTVIPPIGPILILIWAIGLTYAINKFKLRVLTPSYAAGDIISTMSDSLILIDPEGKISEVNNAALKLLGYSKDDIIYQPADLLFSEETPFFKRIELGKIFNKGLFKDYQITFRTKNGMKIPISLSGSLIKDKNDELIGIICVARDMREIIKLHQKEKEFTVEKARSDALQERAHELQEAYNKLKAAQAMLLQSEKMAAVGQLAGGVANEINNPMGVILGFSQIIVKRIKEGDPLYLPIKSIEREAIRCKKLVVDLLTFSRTGKSQFELININQTIDDTLSLIETQANVKNVEITKAYYSGLSNIFANKNLIQQVIVNLCNNAIDAMPGGGKITIATIQEGKQIEIDISDNGIGMSEEVRKHIFEPFFTTKEIGKGTGLGLSLCYEIIQKHNGSIKTESEMGRGSTFRVKLPITES